MLIVETKIVLELTKEKKHERRYGNLVMRRHRFIDLDICLYQYSGWQSGLLPEHEKSTGFFATRRCFLSCDYIRGRVYHYRKFGGNQPIE